MCCLRRLPLRLLFAHQALEPIAKFTPSPVQAASDGPDRHVQNRPDLLVTPAVEVFEDDHCPVFRSKLVERGFDDLLALRSFKRVGRVRIGRFVCRVFKPATSVLTRAADCDPRTPSPVPGEREIHADPVDPRVKRAAAVKLIELLVGARNVSCKTSLASSGDPHRCSKT